MRFVAIAIQLIGLHEIGLTGNTYHRSLLFSVKGIRLLHSNYKFLLLLSINIVEKSLFSFRKNNLLKYNYKNGPGASRIRAMRVPNKLNCV